MCNKVTHKYYYALTCYKITRLLCVSVLPCDGMHYNIILSLYVTGFHCCYGSHCHFMVYYSMYHSGTLLLCCNITLHYYSVKLLLHVSVLHSGVTLYYNVALLGCVMILQCCYSMYFIRYTGGFCYNVTQWCYVCYSVVLSITIYWCCVLSNVLFSYYNFTVIC